MNAKRNRNQPPGVLHCLAVIGICAAVSACGNTNAANSPVKKNKTVPVGVVEAKLLSPSNKIELPGTVLPWATTHLAAEIDGRVERFNFEEGQYVKKGNALLVMRTRPLQLELDLARAEKQRVEMRLKELNTGTRIEVIQGSKAALGKAKARLELENSELQRIEKLAKDGVLSVNELDNAKAAKEEAQAQHDEQKAKLDEFEAGPRIEKIEEEEANLAAAAAKIAIIRDQIQRATIHAPFDGFFVKKETEVGQWLEKGDPGLMMIAADPVKVEVHLPQFHFNQVEPGTTARVILESRSLSESNQVFEGVVIEKIHSGDPTSRTFPIRIKVGNTHGKIAVGMLVRVELMPAAQQTARLYVPKDALVRSPLSTVVWVVEKKDAPPMNVSKVVVTPGEFSGNLIAIQTEDDKITAGDWVVVHGNERLRPGSQVKILSQAP